MPSGEHDAARAWASFGGGQRAPSRIAVLRDREKSTVFLLDGAGPSGEPIVAKHCRTPGGVVERIVYEDILPGLPLHAPHCYGSAGDDDGSLWLFLEYVDGARFTPALPEQRALAARWLALLHSAAAGIPAARALPDRGPDHHLAQLRAARAALLELLERRLATGEARLLEAVVAACDIVEANWAEVEAWCAGMPRTLVHGDFRPKNVYVRSGGIGEPQLLALDWEMAGWGVPAADVASLRGAPGETAALRAYVVSARARWPRLAMDAPSRWIETGRLFRRIAAIAWCCASLPQRWARSILALEVHRAELAAFIAGARW